MFNHDAKIARRLSRALRRVMVVDPVEASARAVGALLFDLGRPDVWTAPTAAKALKLAAKVDPDLIVCELDAEGVDGLAFTRALRRSDLACRQAPVILTGREPSAASVLAARDAGAHEVLARPFTTKALLLRLDVALLQPRDWIEALDYVGPDRRRFNSAEAPEAGHRRAEAGAPDSVRIGQALKIVRAAMAAMASDPGQAQRALMAQVQLLEAIAAEQHDARLAQGCRELRDYLATAPSPLSRADVERHATGLLAYLPRDGEGRAAA